jgi:hypothetical protein
VATVTGLITMHCDLFYGSQYLKLHWAE